MPVRKHLPDLSKSDRERAVKRTDSTKKNRGFTGSFFHDPIIAHYCFRLYQKTAAKAVDNTYALSKTVYNKTVE